MASRLAWWDALNPLSVVAYLEQGGDPNRGFARGELDAEQGRPRDARVKRLALGEGVRLLHLAVSSGSASFDAVLALTNAGADVEAVTSLGKTAYDFAMEYHENEWPPFLFSRLCPTRLLTGFFVATNRLWQSAAPWPGVESDVGPITLARGGTAPMDLRPNFAVNPVSTTKEWSLLSGPLIDELRKPGKTGVAVFVPGYNTSFRAALDNALLACTELPSLVPFLFSWPSAQQELEYPADCATCEASATRFENTMSDLIQLCNDLGKDVVCLGHTMGCRLLMRVLGAVAIMDGLFVRSVYLAAADIDRYDFEERVHNIVSAATSAAGQGATVTSFLLLATGKEPKWHAHSTSGRPFQRAGFVDPQHGFPLVVAPHTMSVDASLYSSVADLLKTGGYFKFRLGDDLTNERIVMEKLVRDVVVYVFTSAVRGSHDLEKKFALRGMARTVNDPAHHAFGYVLKTKSGSMEESCAVS